MPLSAKYDGARIRAFEFGSDAWKTLKATYEDHILVTICCGEPAIPKVSPMGIHFFAHKAKNNCPTGAESNDHLFLKATVAHHAMIAGWQAETEVRGATPEGKPWVADVLCTKGKAQVAIEIQLAQQTLEQLYRRQDRYSESNVRGAWLTGFPLHSSPSDVNHPSKYLPAFTLQLNDDRSATIREFDTELGAFIHGMLNGDLDWQPPRLEYRIANLRIHYRNAQCQHCGLPFKRIMALEMGGNDNVMEIPTLNVLRSARVDDQTASAMLKMLREKPYSTNWRQVCPSCRKVVNTSNFGRQRQYLANQMRTQNDHTPTPIVTPVTVGKRATDDGSWVFQGKAMNEVPPDSRARRSGEKSSQEYRSDAYK